MLLAVIACVPAMADSKSKGNKNRTAMRREVMDFKLKYLAQEMELKDDQEKKFFELYSQMTDEKAKLYKETRELEKKIEDDKDATDADYEAVTRAINEAKEKETSIDKRYDEKFAQFLTPRQIFKMKGAEDKFRTKMHEMRHKNKSSKKKSK